MRDHSIEEWVKEYTDDLLSWAAFKVSDQELAKDLVQDTFLAASQKIDAFKGDSSVKTWLFSILNFKIIDHYRAKTKQPVNFGEIPTSNFFSEDGEWLSEKKPSAWDDEEENILDDTDFNLILQKCIDALPDKWSTSIKLKYILSKNGEEICQELGITPTNFWQILHRAKLQLRECLENNWFKENSAS